MPKALTQSVFLLIFLSLHLQGEAPSVPTFSYDVVRILPHDPGAFTQGLLLHNGFLYEGTGQKGASTIRKIQVDTGRVLKSRALADNYFGEGITVLDEKIYQLTWKSKKGFVYNLKTFEKESEFDYDSEGWGLTQDGQSLIMSDGTQTIRFLDPNTFKERRSLSVSYQGRPTRYLNELEYAHNHIYANIWTTDYLAKIDPKSGHIVALIDVRGLLPNESRAQTDVFNGIAYNLDSDTFYVTGKWWPKVFEIKLVPPKPKPDS